MGKTEKQIVGRMIFRIVIAGVFLVALAGLLMAYAMGTAAFGQTATPEPDAATAGAWVQSVKWTDCRAEPVKAERWADVVLKGKASGDEAAAQRRAAMRVKAIGLRQQKRFDEAAAFLESVDFEKMRTESPPDYSALKHLQAMTYLRLDRVDEARATIDQALEAEPENNSLQCGAILVLEAEGKQDAAVEAAIRYLERDNAGLGSVHSVKRLIEPRSLTAEQRARVVEAIKGMRFRHSTGGKVSVATIDALDILASNYE